MRHWYAKKPPAKVDEVADELVRIVRDTLEKFMRKYDQDRSPPDAQRSDIYTAIGKTNHRITGQYQKMVELESKARMAEDQFNRLNRKMIELEQAMATHPELEKRRDGK